MNHARHRYNKLIKKRIAIFEVKRKLLNELTPVVKKDYINGSDVTNVQYI
jgi:hypothetical protein